MLNANVLLCLLNVFECVYWHLHPINFKADNRSMWCLKFTVLPFEFSTFFYFIIHWRPVLNLCNVCTQYKLQCSISSICYTVSAFACDKMWLCKQVYVHIIEKYTATHTSTHNQAHLRANNPLSNSLLVSKSWKWPLTVVNRNKREAFSPVSLSSNKGYRQLPLLISVAASVSDIHSLLRFSGLNYTSL